ncbi:MULTISPECIES: hypothetical protein [Streptomyces]|nr:MULTISPECIES: hypothetical protein [Streptomyces]MBD3575283.1 hypothetical protein [Streptomyces sp. KD18]
MSRTRLPKYQISGAHESSQRSKPTVEQARTDGRPFDAGIGVRERAVDRM